MVKHKGSALSVLTLLVCLSCCNIFSRFSIEKPILQAHASIHNSSKKDSFINNPFTFTILKNYSDDFSSIGTILDSSSTCPLQKENIADPSFCFLRSIKFNGLTVNIFSFDVLQGGTAEYIVTNNAIRLKNGITIGSTKKELVKKLGKPYRIKDDKYIWRSSDLSNYLVFSLTNDEITQIRWHEEREPTYKGIIVWQAKYD